MRNFHDPCLGHSRMPSAAERTRIGARTDTQPISVEFASNGTAGHHWGVAGVDRPDYQNPLSDGYMKRTEALQLLEQKLHLGSPLTGKEELTQVSWDSIAAIGFVALADEYFGVEVNGDDLVRCQSVDNLLGLLGDHIAD